MKNSFSAFLILFFSFNLMAAQYEVPVPSEIKEYSIFSLDDFDKKLDGDEITIKYHLPKMLVGDTSRIKLTGKIVGSSNNSQEIEMKGEFGSAKCAGSYNSMKCVIEYHDLVVNEVEALKAIQAQSSSAEEEAGRIQVMKAFSTDPVGIITY